MKNILIWVGVGVIALSLGAFLITRNPIPVSSEVTATTSVSVSTSTATTTLLLNTSGISSDNLIQDKVSKTLNATNAEQEKAPETKKTGVTLGGKNLASDCANFVIAKANEDLKYPPVVIPRINSRVRMVTSQEIRFNLKGEGECIVEDRPHSDKYGTSTVYDAFGGRIISMISTDYDTPAQEGIDSNTIPSPQCVILGKPNCTNQQYIDFVRETMRGSDGADWSLLTSPEYSYRLFFPVLPFLNVSSTSDRGEVRGFESWTAGVGYKDSDRFSIMSWKYPSVIASPVLNLSVPLQGLVHNFLELVSVDDPVAKLVSTTPIQHDGNQALDFEIKTASSTIQGRSLLIRDKSYILVYECSKSCSEVLRHAFLDSFKEIK